MTTPVTLRDVFNQLIAEGLQLPENYTQRVFSSQPPDHPPWYVRLFAGLGAWIAAMLLVAFLFVAEIIQNEIAALGLGLIACCATAFLSRHQLSSDFMRQLGLSLSLLGQLLVTFGMTSIDNSVVFIASAVIIMELVLLFAYADQLHRFLSTLFIVGALITIFSEIDQLELIHGLIILLAVIVSLVIIREYELLVSPWWDMIHPMSHAAAIALLGLLVLPLQTRFMSQWWWITAIALLGILLGVIWQITTDLQVTLDRSLIWVLPIIGLGLALLSVKMPGIAAALLIFVLGFWRSNRILIGLAAIFFVFYLGAYYYSLQMTLLTKSFALLGTGGLLLILRYVLARTQHKGTGEP